MRVVVMESREQRIERRAHAARLCAPIHMSRMFNQEARRVTGIEEP
jgi:hypothetical protein